MQIDPEMTVGLNDLCDLLSVFVYELIKILNEQVPAPSIAAGDGHFRLEIRNRGKVAELIENIINTVREPVSAFLGVGHKLFVLL